MDKGTGIVASIVSGVVIYWLTVGFPWQKTADPVPAPPPYTPLPLLGNQTLPPYPTVPLIQTQGRGDPRSRRSWSWKDPNQAYATQGRSVTRENSQVGRFCCDADWERVCMAQGQGAGQNCGCPNVRPLVDFTTCD